MVASTIASKANWKKTSGAVAPSARRVPISVVRSRTAIHAMASTPRPDTTSPLSPTQRTKKPRRSAESICVPMRSCWLPTLKSSGRKAEMRWRTRSSSAMSV